MNDTTDKAKHPADDHESPCRAAAETASGPDPHEMSEIGKALFEMANAMNRLWLAQWRREHGNNT